MISLEEFIKKYTNKPVDYEGVYPNQCMDLMHLYKEEVLGVKGMGILSKPAAYQVFANFVPAWGEYFEIIKNTLLNWPKKGDIIFWGTKIGPYGHTAICVSANVFKFTSFDANWPVDTLPHLQEHNYVGVLGWLRVKKVLPKGGDMKGTPLNTEVNILPKVEALRVRSEPHLSGKIVHRLAPKDNPITVVGYLKGDLVKDNELGVASSYWYEDANGNWFTAAYTDRPDPAVDPKEENILDGLHGTKHMVFATQEEKDARVAALEAELQEAKDAKTQAEVDAEAAAAAAEEAKQAEVAQLKARLAELGVTVE